MSHHLSTAYDGLPELQAVEPCGNLSDQEIQPHHFMMGDVHTTLGRAALTSRTNLFSTRNVS